MSADEYALSPCPTCGSTGPCNCHLPAVAEKLRTEIAGLRDLAFKTSLFLSVLRGALTMKPELWERFEEIHNELAAASHGHAPMFRISDPTLRRARKAWLAEVERMVLDALKPAAPTPPTEQTTTERERLKAAVLGFCENKMHRPWLRELAKLFDP